MNNKKVYVVIIESENEITHIGGVFATLEDARFYCESIFEDVDYEYEKYICFETYHDGSSFWLTIETCSVWADYKEGTFVKGE